MLLAPPSLPPLPPSTATAAMPAPINDAVDPPTQRDLSTASLLKQLAQEGDIVRYGDEIFLRARSNYCRLPKPDVLDPLQTGWTKEELEWGYLGVYVKPDGITDRVFVPPLGSLAKGTKRESHFIVEHPTEGGNAKGRTVLYGDTVVLLDENGMVWNNKTGGFLYDGYLAPRDRGIPGEVFVSFSKNELRGHPVRYKDAGVFIDVVESHRYRQGFNNRLTNYKSNNAKVLGGYLCSDGSGDPLLVSVERFKGKTKPRPMRKPATAPANTIRFGEEDSYLASATAEANSRVRGISRSPALTSVSVVFSNGKTDVMRQDPPYNSTITIYGLKSDAQLELVLDDGSVAVLEGGSEALIRAGLLGKADTRISTLRTGPTTTIANGIKNELGLSIVKAPPSKSIESSNRTVLSRNKIAKLLVADVLKLMVAYFAIAIGLFMLSTLWRWIQDDDEWGTGASLEDLLIALGAQSLPGGGDRTKSMRLLTIFGTSGANRRLVGAALTLCWLFGFATPPIIRNQAVAYHTSNNNTNNISPITPTWLLTVSFVQPPPPSSPLILPSTNGTNNNNSGQTLQHTKSMFIPSGGGGGGVGGGGGGGSTSFFEEEENEGPPVEAYRAPGINKETGLPLHPAFIRFLNGERGDRTTALKRWNVTCEWRKEHQVDDILNVGHRMFFLIKGHYPAYFYGRDLHGHPIYIERVGKVNMKALRAGGAKLKDIVYHYIYMTEFQWSILEPAEYAQSVTILDCAGIGIFDFAGDVSDFVKKTMAIIQEHFPERGFMVFLINVPSWFGAIWKVVEVFVNPRTREKIRILRGPSEYEPELFKIIRKSSLPEVYGGTNKDALENSVEERMLRNTVIRTLLKTSTEAIGPDGHIMTHAQLEAMIDPSVDQFARVSRMSKLAPDGVTPLCDDKGVPLVKG